MQDNQPWERCDFNMVDHPATTQAASPAMLAGLPPGQPPGFVSSCYGFVMAGDEAPGRWPINGRKKAARRRLPGRGTRPLNPGFRRR
jgi:hypothetical protein